MAKLGTNKRPAVARVQSLDRAEELTAFCAERGWKVIVGVEPGQFEDISDIEKLLRDPPKPAPTRLPPKISGNDYCPCGSGNKYKKCCGAPKA